MRVHAFGAQVAVFGFIVVDILRVLLLASNDAEPT
jgi:hypothetical protein